MFSYLCTGRRNEQSCISQKHALLIVETTGINALYDLLRLIMLLGNSAQMSEILIKRPSNVLYMEGQHLGMYDAVHGNTWCPMHFYNEQGLLISLSLSCSLLQISVRRSTLVTRSFRSITKLWCVSLHGSG